ncbi:APC family permease [Clostridium sardiniense]|uniref:APC family permease n=1 Tax=Clostridium sardiniense TaxID=29369 RepID=UPI003D354E9D
MSIFRTQSFESVSKHVGDANKTLGTLDLTLMSIGSVIGTGVMVLTGIVAAKEAGPAVAISFVLGAIAAAVIVLCYAELSASIQSSGGSYTFTYVTLGEIIAYIAGLCIAIGYVLSTATVASGWGSYFLSLLDVLNIHLPKAITSIPAQGGIVNLPAIFSIIFITFVISCGTKSSKKVNDAMVIIKLGVIALFLVVGAMHMHSSNLIPFTPYGTTGVITGASSVFFAYCGFDATASAAPYVKNPKKALPIGLLSSLLVCVLIYIAVSLVLTGITKYYNLNVPDALSYALKVAGKPMVAFVVSLGTVIGILAVIFAGNFTTSQILSTMSRDGLLPKIFSKKDKNDVPYVSLWTIGILSSVLAGFFNLKDLANFASIAFLLVYGTVSFSIIIFRKKYPNIERSFKTPLVPIIPIIGTLCCIFLMVNLSLSTWIIFAIVLVIILLAYFFYGKNNSIVGKEMKK